MPGLRQAGSTLARQVSVDVDLAHVPVFKTIGPSHLAGQRHRPFEMVRRKWNKGHRRITAVGSALGDQARLSHPASQGRRDRPVIGCDTAVGTDQGGTINLKAPDTIEH